MRSDSQVLVVVKRRWLHAPVSPEEKDVKEDGEHDTYPSSRPALAAALAFGGDIAP